MTYIFKPLASEIAVTSANTVYDSKLVRVYSESQSVVTITDQSGSNTSFTVPSGAVTIVEKDTTDTIAGSVSILCTPMAYR